MIINFCCGFEFYSLWSLWASSDLVSSKFLQTGPLGLFNSQTSKSLFRAVPIHLYIFLGGKR